MVKIIADTLACLYPEVAEKYNIPIIPQIINFGNDSYMEGVDLDINTFMEKLKTCKELPKTAAPKVELFINEFARLEAYHEPVICIHPSGDVSGTVRSAQTAAAEFPQMDIRVIDTRLIAGPLATLVEIAAKMAQEGSSADAIVERVQKMAARCRIYFLVDTLEYLARGGRIGGATHLLGSILQIKPILTFENGQVNEFEKARTHNHALERLKQLVIKEYPKNGEGYLTVNQADVPDKGRALADDLGKKLGITNVPVYNMPPAIITHGGPGVLAVGFFIE